VGRHFRPDEANTQSLTRWFCASAQPNQSSTLRFPSSIAFFGRSENCRCHARSEFLRHTDHFLSCFVHSPRRSANQKRRVTMTTLLIDSIAIGLAPASVPPQTGVQHRWVGHLEVIAEAIMRFSPRERHRHADCGFARGALQISSVESFAPLVATICINASNLLCFDACVPRLP